MPPLQGLILVGLLFLPLVWALFSGKRIPAIGYLVALSSVVLLTQPKLCFWLFLLSLGLWLPFRRELFALHPYDIAASLLVGAALFDVFLRVNSRIAGTPFDVPFILFIIAGALSLVFAQEPSLGFVPFARICFIYIVFRALLRILPYLNIRSIVIGYVLFVTSLSLMNVIIFINSGGTARVFGLPGLGYETLSMTAFPMALSIMLYHQSRAGRFFYVIASGILLAGIIATQARGPLLTVLLCLPVLYAMYHRFPNTAGTRTGGGMKNVFMILTAVTVLLIAGSTTIFEGFFGRVALFFASASEPQGTVALRLLLWSAALKGFLTAPVFGIGLGNFGIIEQIVPEVRASPLWYYVRFMSTHNVVLHYLVETGPLGVFALLFLAWRGLKVSFAVLKRPQFANDRQVSSALFMGMFVFAITLLYMRAWTWEQGSHVLPLLCAMTFHWKRTTSSA